MELLRTTMYLFRIHFGRSLTGRRGWIMLVLSLIPVAVAWTLGRFAPKLSAADLVTHLGWLLCLQVIVPIQALIAGSAVIAEEVEDRTVSYLFSRPIPRASVLFGRWFAAVAFLSIASSLSITALWIAASGTVSVNATLSDGIYVPLVYAALAGGAVYSAVFAVAGVYLKHPMIAGLAYAFAVEGLFANLPGRTQSLSIQYYLRSLIAGSGSEAWKRVEGFLAAEYAPPTEAILTLAIILASALAFGAWRIQRREFVLTS